MSAGRVGDAVHYESRRAAPSAELRVRYRPTGPAFQARPGTLEHFLAERYCLYVVDADRRVLRADIHHPPWWLQAAEGEFERNTMTAPYGIELAGAAPLLHFSARQDVVLWPLLSTA
jgi:uncharacterized protein YqjF (DUF2071 family)